MACFGRKLLLFASDPEVKKVIEPAADAASSTDAGVSEASSARGEAVLAEESARPSPGEGGPEDRLRAESAGSEEEAHSADSSEEAASPHADDLGWAPEDSAGGLARSVSAVIESGRGLTRALTIASHKAAASTAGDETEEEEKEEPFAITHRLQVHFDDGWRDFNPEDTKLILAKLAEADSDETAFHLNLRGHEYSFVFRSSGDASQINVKSGKRRQVRILDGPAADETNHGLQENAHFLEEQRRLGPQSRRGGASQSAIHKYLDGNKHAQSCFEVFEKHEAKLCGEWAVFYHSYSFAALIYEVHAAVASVLFRFRSQYASLPRILVGEFLEIPDAATLIQKFNTEFAEHKRDHNPGFRKVGISAMCSLAATGPEACVARVFVQGYSCKDVSFRSVLENVLEACYVPKDRVAKVATKIIKLSEKHGLDVSQFGGKPCKSHQAGHLMQIFIRRSLVDELVYAAEPYGPADEARMPMSRVMNSDECQLRGQARIVAHPKYFMQANCVRMFVASADPTFHKNRAAFQEELCQVIKELAEPSLRERAAAGIWGGTLPSWWTAEDQRNMA